MLLTSFEDRLHTPNRYSSHIKHISHITHFTNHEVELWTSVLLTAELHSLLNSISDECLVKYASSKSINLIST